MKRIIHLLIIVIFSVNFIGCASKANDIDASYVSPVQYNNYDCEQIGQELQRVHRQVRQISGKQDKAAGKDAVALTVGLVLFWPALFFMMGGDKKEELSMLKGEYEALQQAAIAKRCDLSKTKEAIKKEEESFEKKNKTEMENQQENDAIH